MDALSKALLDFIAAENNPIGLAVIAASALIEYLFPPFPGDTVTLFAAVLITAYAWSFWGVFGALMLGSVAGSMAAFYVGGRLQARRARQAAKAHTQRAMLDVLTDRFRRYGVTYLVLNRFMPGIRAFFFVAAGLAGMRPLPVLLCSALSAALWNLGILAIGAALGANLDTLIGWMKTYTTVVWIVLAAVVVLACARILWRRRKARAAAKAQGPQGPQDPTQ